MGCDIHPHIEIKINGHWHHYASWSFPRWYGVFEKLAGVHGDDNKAMVPPRGVPDDLSTVTAVIWTMEKNWCHTPSWLTWDELLSFIKWCDDCLPNQNFQGEFTHHNIPYLFDNHYTKDTTPAAVEDVRFVFWFDN